MTYFILISAASLLVLVALIWAAPRGWQDDAGFHYGQAPHRPLAQQHPAASAQHSRSAVSDAEQAVTGQELAAAE